MDPPAPDPAADQAPPADEAPVRLALVELLSRDPDHPYPSQAFGHARGLDALPGVRVEWWRIGTGEDPANLAPEVAPADREALLERLAAFGATHVVLNVPPDPRLAEALSRLPGPPTVFRDSGERTGLRHPLWPILDGCGLRERFERRWPGCTDPGEHVRVSYRAGNLNAAADALEVRFEVPVGRRCTWRRPLGRNPHFAALPEFADWSGCSFCGSAEQRGPVPGRVPPMDLLFQHVEAAVYFPGVRGSRPSFNLMGSFAFLNLREFTRRLLALPGYPPSRFLFTCRVDEFLRQADTLQSLLPSVEAAGHQFHLFCLGIENLSPVENERLNKGITAAQVEAARDRMARLGADHPDTFGHPAGNLSFILFTPWTTVEDLAHNLREARRLGIDRGGTFLRSRLQLLPGMPVTALARHDGLLDEAAEDHPFFSGCIRSTDVRELPWRFLHPGIAACYAVMRRLDPVPDVPGDDPLLAALRQALLHVPVDVLGIDDLLDLCVEATRDRPAADPLDLAADVARRARDRPDAPGAVFRSAPATAAQAARALSRVAAARPDFLLGHRPVSVRVVPPRVLLGFQGPDGPAELEVLPLAAGVPGTARSERYRVCTPGDPRGRERPVDRLAARIASLLDGLKPPPPLPIPPRS